jgi:hypothetical protein
MLDFLLQKKQKQTQKEAKHESTLASKKNKTPKEATRSRLPGKDDGRQSLPFPVYPFYATLRDRAETLQTSASLQARGFTATKTNISYVKWEILAELGHSKEEVLLQKEKTTKEMEQERPENCFLLDQYKSQRKGEQEKPKQKTFDEKHNPYFLLRSRVGGPPSQLVKTKTLLGFGKILAKRKKSPVNTRINSYFLAKRTLCFKKTNQKEKQKTFKTEGKAQNISQKKDRANLGEAFKIQQEHKIELEPLGRKKISKGSKVKTKTLCNPKVKCNNAFLSQKLGNSYTKTIKEHK